MSDRQTVIENAALEAQALGVDYDDAYQFFEATVPRPPALSSEDATRPTGEET